MKVVKFGGSSLSCEAQFKKVRNIILSDPTRTVVVVSALGRRFDKDSKITDLLYILHAHLKYHVPYDDIWNMISSRFIEVKNMLGLRYDIEAELKKIKNELSTSISEEYLVSRGEYLTAHLVADYLGYSFVDSKNIIKFTYDSKIDYEKTDVLIKKAGMLNKKMVVPGFYGAYPDGNVKLLSRGGSDVTGAILARALSADIYENWTDVSGILMADPRIVKNPKPIKEITYHELRELSYMGANVLHEETIFPVQELNIPINIRNTNQPDDVGTLILNDCSDKSQIVTGIAGKKNFISYTIFKDHMSNEVGFVRKCLSIFEKHGISIEHLPTGIDSIAVVVSALDAAKWKYELVLELKNELQADKVNIQEDLSLIAIVGRNMAGHIGMSGKLFNILGQNDINIKLITQGPEELNIIVGINTKDYDKTIRIIYDYFVQKED